MRLIINFGNQDITAKESGKKDSFLPCGKDREFGYASRVQFFSKVLEDVDDFSIEEDGSLSNPFYIKKGPDGIDHTFTTFDFPILRKEIKKALEISGQESLHVTAFVTRQDDKNESYKDTYGIVDILNGSYGKNVFPNVQFDFVEIHCDPSDFLLVHEEYSRWFSSQEFNEEVMVVVGPGTPAMVNALATCSIRYCNKLKQFYSSYKNKKTEVLKLSFFTNSEFAVAKDKLKKAFEAGDYTVAKILISEPPLSYIPGLDCFVDYFDNRRNYKFVDACKCYKECITCNDIFYPLEACSIKLDEMQNFINGDNKGNYDYTKDGAVFVLFESLLNAEFFYEKEQYFTAVAFLNAFLDMMTNYLIGKALGFNMKYNSKECWYYGLDKVIQEKVFCSDVVKNKYEDDINAWGKEHNLKKDKEKLIEMMAIMPEGELSIKQDVLNRSNKTFKRQSSFRTFGNLRNSLPIAHNPKGISRDEIEKTLKNDWYSVPEICADNKFIGVVEVFKNILIDSVPQYPKELFDDYRKKGVEIIESLSLEF